MKRLGNVFVAVMRSPHSAPWVVDAIRLQLSPHALGGYVLGVGPEDGSVTLEGFATADDLRAMSTMFAAAADVLAAKAAA